MPANTPLFASRLTRRLALASVALSAMTPALIVPARAQALQPVVDVCTGISLPRSAVTQVIGAVNAPIVSQIEASVDALKTVSIVVAPLINVPDLNIDLSGILANAAAGQPISLQVLDTQGNIVSPGNCNVAADGLTLNTPAGIAIGGNAITGLGANGQTATAVPLDAIAFGNNASATAAATGGVAIGTGASVTAANGVAIGAGALADRGAQTAYAAPGLTGTFSSIGSVSVGTAGGLRQITNVAPGTAASDAATVGQVQGALAATATLAGVAVQYNDATKAAVTLGGAGGTTIDNLAPGTVSAASTQAVNGAQLFATNQTVAGNTTAIGALDAAAVKYDDPSNTVVTFEGAGGTRLTNVTPGALNAASTDAVNGSQLFATNQAVAGLDTRVTANTTAITNIDARLTTTQAAVANAVQYDDATKAAITLGGANGTTIGNVAPGTVAAGSTQAVNGSQLFATNQQVAGNSSAITNLDGRVTANTTNIANNTTAIGNLDGRVTTNTTTIANLDGRVTTIDGRVTNNTTAISNLDGRVTNNTTAITNLDGRVTSNTTNITTLQTQVANVPVRYVDDADKSTPSATPTNTVALAPATASAATLTKVGAGTLSATSTDAVNGSQLFATNTQVASNTTAITQLSTTLAGAPRTPVQYSNQGTPTTANGGTPTNDVTLVGANPAAPVALHNVANGMLGNDAANLGQLQNGVANAISTSRAYTDQQIAAIGFDLADLGKDVRHLRNGAFSGTAAAMAVAGIPQTMEIGKSMIGGGVGHYRGRTAFALGASTTLNDGQAVVKAGATMDTNGKGGFSAGAGFAF